MVFALEPFAPSRLRGGSEQRALLAGAGGAGRVGAQVRGVVPEAQEGFLAGAQFDQVQGAFVLRPAAPVLADRSPGEGGAEDAQGGLVRNGEHGTLAAFVRGADLLERRERALAH